jgi:hypothetical protein
MHFIYKWLKKCRFLAVGFGHLWHAALLLHWYATQISQPLALSSIISLQQSCRNGAPR